MEASGGSSPHFNNLQISRQGYDISPDNYKYMLLTIDLVFFSCSGCRLLQPVDCSSHFPLNCRTVMDSKAESDSNMELVIGDAITITEDKIAGFDDLPEDEASCLPQVEKLPAPSTASLGMGTLMLDERNYRWRYVFINRTKVVVYLLLTHEVVRLRKFNLTGGSTSGAIGFELDYQDSAARVYPLLPGESYGIKHSVPMLFKLTAAIETSGGYQVMFRNHAIRRGYTYTFVPTDLQRKVDFIHTLTLPSPPSAKY